MNGKFALLALLLVAASAYAADSQVYKWTDAAGVTHYSDAPPPKDTQNVQTVRVSGGDRPHAVASENENTDKPKDAAANSSSTAAAGDPAAAHAKECQDARSNLELLQGKMPVAVKNADGTTMPLNDNARQAQIAAANAQIATYCQ